MREIKFRCWNGEDMISPDYITRDGRGCWTENSIPTSSDKLMQFTGLLDKNGKEIYEGDVCVNAFGDKHEVFWTGGAFLFGDKERFWFLNQVVDIEVIGNIYEKSLIK